MKRPPSEQEIIQGIKAHDSSVLEYVYEHCYPVIEAYVIHHHGNRDQAQDVFQEAMIIAYKRIRSGTLELSCKFGTYLYGICKKVWIQEKRKYRLRAEKLRQQPLVVHEPEVAEDPEITLRMKAIFDLHFSQLSPDCQKILSMFFNMHSVEEIRQAMEYKDIHHTADRKYRCKKSLMKRILNDPRFKKLRDETR